MPAPAGFRMCAACGTRNNPKWEFCVRCGEALDPGSDQEFEVAEAEPEEVVPITTGFPWRTVLLLAAAVGVIVVSVVVKPAEKQLLRLIQLPNAKPPEPAPLPPVTQVPAPMAKLSQGRALLAQNNHAEALGPLAEAAALEPGNADIQLNYARALWGTGSQEEALSHFETASQLSGDFRTAYAHALLQAARPADARKVLEEALEAKPDDLDAMETLGRLHNQEGRTAEAAALLSRAAAMKPNDPQLVAHLGYALEKNGNLEQAAQVLTGVVESVPASTIARELLAEAQFKQGKREEAVAVVREGLERRPDSPDLYRRLGSLLDRAGRAAEAAAAYREYLRLAPEAVDARAVSERAARLERTAGSTGAS